MGILDRIVYLLQRHYQIVQIKRLESRTRTLTALQELVLTHEYVFFRISSQEPATPLVHKANIALPQMGYITYGPVLLSGRYIFFASEDSTAFTDINVNKATVKPYPPLFHIDTKRAHAIDERTGRFVYVVATLDQST